MFCYCCYVVATGIFRKPDAENFNPSPDSIPLTIICDNIREPGNLGAILRTCAGAGCHKIILTKGERL